METNYYIGILLAVLLLASLTGTPNYIERNTQSDTVVTMNFTVRG